LSQVLFFQVLEFLPIDRRKLFPLVLCDRNFCKIGTQILDLARRHQIGRVPRNGTIVPFDFTEGWFRNKQDKTMFCIAFHGSYTSFGLTRQHQNGRVAENVTNVALNFIEQFLRIQICNTTQGPPGRKKKITSCRRAISHNSFIHFKIIDKKNKNVV